MIIHITNYVFKIHITICLNQPIVSSNVTNRPDHTRPCQIRPSLLPSFPCFHPSFLPHIFHTVKSECLVILWWYTTTSRRKLEISISCSCTSERLRCSSTNFHLVFTSRRRQQSKSGRRPEIRKSQILRKIWSSRSCRAGTQTTTLSPFCVVQTGRLVREISIKSEPRSVVNWSLGYLRCIGPVTTPTHTKTLTPLLYCATSFEPPIVHTVTSAANKR